MGGSDIGRVSREKRGDLKEDIVPKSRKEWDVEEKEARNSQGKARGNEEGIINWSLEALRAVLVEKKGWNQVGGGV